MTMEPEKHYKYTFIVVPVAVTNGIISGISSVIAAYFFKPLWNKIIGFINNERKIN
jgi:hypothetical protein